MKTKFRTHVVIEGECDGHISAEDIIRVLNENVVMYFPDDDSVKPKELEDAVIGISDVMMCKVNREQ